MPKGIVLIILYNVYVERYYTFDLRIFFRIFPSILYYNFIHYFFLSVNWWVPYSDIFEYVSLETFLLKWILIVSR